MIKLQAAKTGSVRAILSLTLGVSISSLANAAKVEIPDTQSQMTAVVDIRLPQDDMMYNVMQSEIMLTSLLSQGSTVVSAEFAGVEHTAIASVTP